MSITAHFTLADWLKYIDAQHPKSIAMGLDRVRDVAIQLQLNPTFPIITVAGTNGKGSTCAMLASVYQQAGYTVGCYTSPHLLRFNERVHINNQAISDEDLCNAFAAVEDKRGGIALTYFEIGTLAAVWHFCHANVEVGHLDLAILEVGLGGRLDAVNIFEPTCSIVTTIDLDHMEYLGDTTEKIGFEKAGVFRANKLAICGDENPPKSLMQYAAQIGANLQLINRDFSVTKNTLGWQYSAGNVAMQLPKLKLAGDFQLTNAACVVCAIQHLNAVLPVTQANINQAFEALSLIGRFYKLPLKSPQGADIIVDVAHNPHAAKSLAHNLHTTPCLGRTLAVFAMLADKDIIGVVQAVTPYIDTWYLADNHSARGAKADDLHHILLKQANPAAIFLFSDVASAVAAACKDAAKNDRIIVFGSFYTVADAINYGNIHLTA